MNSVTYSTARQHLSDLINKVCDEHEPVIITRKTTNSAIMISLEDFNAIQETAYLLKSSKNAKHLRKSIKQFKEGKYKERGLICKGLDWTASFGIHMSI